MLAGAMKNTKRLLLGFLSSALLSMGLARAAESIDPITLSTGRDSLTRAIKCASNSGGVYCNFASENE